MVEKPSDSHAKGRARTNTSIFFSKLTRSTILKGIISLLLRNDHKVYNFWAHLCPPIVYLDIGKSYSKLKFRVYIIDDDPRCPCGGNSSAYAHGTHFVEVAEFMYNCS